jgi:integrase
VADGYYRSTINHMVSRIKKFFRWCCQEELCPPGLYYQLMAISGLVKGENGALEPPPVKPATLESMRGVIPFLRPAVAAMIQVQFRCGLRPNEACRMGMQFIDSSRSTWLYFPERHKNQWRGATSVKAVPPSAQKILEPFVKNEPYFFTTGKSGQLYTTSGYRQAVARGFKAAAKKGVKLEPFKPNQLRHSIATIIAQSLGHRAAQVWCGHDKPNTTALYIAKQSAELIQVSEQLEAISAISE